MSKILQSIDETHNMYQYSDGFSFGTDAVLLSGFVRPRKNSVGAEFGTGGGIIPLLLSIHKEFKKLYALEIQEDYALLAKENIALNGFEDKVEVICGDLKRAEDLIPFPCDFVFTNPPYMKKDSGKVNETEKKRIARHEVLCDIRDVCRSASRLLQDKGEFFCVYRMVRLPELFSAMKEFSLEPKDMIPVISTPGADPALVLVRGVKGAKADLKCRAPFLIQDETGEKSPECQVLYKTGVISYGGRNQ